MGSDARLFQAGVEGGQIVDIRIGQRCHEGVHQGLFASAILERFQLFHQIGCILTRQMGIVGDHRLAFHAVTGGTDRRLGFAGFDIGSLGLMTPRQCQQGQGIYPFLHLLLLELKNDGCQ